MKKRITNFQDIKTKKNTEYLGLNEYPGSPIPVNDAVDQLIQDQNISSGQDPQNEGTNPSNDPFAEFIQKEKKPSSLFSDVLLSKKSAHEEKQIEEPSHPDHQEEKSQSNNSANPQNQSQSNSNNINGQNVSNDFLSKIPILKSDFVDNHASSLELHKNQDSYEKQNQILNDVKPTGGVYQVEVDPVLKKTNRLDPVFNEPNGNISGITQKAESAFGEDNKSNSNKTIKSTTPVSTSKLNDPGLQTYNPNSYNVNIIPDKKGVFPSQFHHQDPPFITNIELFDAEKNYSFDLKTMTSNINEFGIKKIGNSARAPTKKVESTYN